MSPPIGTCKTSSPVNSTELFDAPTSAIAGPVARASRYHSQSSTGSHDESYISTHSERRTQISRSTKVGRKTIDTDSKSESTINKSECDRLNKLSFSDSKSDLIEARIRHENIKRYG